MARTAPSGTPGGGWGDEPRTRHPLGCAECQYIHPRTQKGIGIVGQPEPHYYFHRPLATLLGACFAAGFVMDGIEEPTFAPGEASPRALSWAHFTNIPPVLVARVRPAG